MGILTNFLTEIAEAIRTKKNSAEPIIANNFAEEILNLSTGGDSKENVFANTESSAEKITEMIEEISDNFDTGNRTSGYSMFQDCKNLKKVPLLNTGKITNIGAMFYKCKSIQEVNLSDTSKVTNSSSTFRECDSLKKICKLNMGANNNVYYMFYNCKSLEEFGGLVDIGKAYTAPKDNNGNYALDFSNSTKLSYESLMNIINNLYDLNLTFNVANGGTLYTQSLSLGSTNKAKLTSEEIAIATEKGWTVS